MDVHGTKLVRTLFTIATGVEHYRDDLSIERRTLSGGRDLRSENPTTNFGA